MRTVRLLTVRVVATTRSHPGTHPPTSGLIPPEGTWDHTHALPCWQTDTCENITLPQLR